MMLSARELAFSYKNQKILKDICFSVQARKIITILGPNGVGKTTLLKCLNRILKPWGGDVRVKGNSVQGMGVKEISRKIAYVAQASEPAKLTAFDAVLMGRKPHMGLRPSSSDIEKVDAVIRHLNLSDLRLKTLDKMSGGELQTVCIARSLAQETDILLMDEPTASLDLKNQTHILNLIRHIVKDHNMAAVITMHDLNMALRYADQYVFLKDQTVYSTGEVKDITPEMITHVYGIEVEIINHKGCPLVIPVQNEKKAA